MGDTFYLIIPRGKRWGFAGRNFREGKHEVDLPTAKAAQRKGFTATPFDVPDYEPEPDPRIGGYVDLPDKDGMGTLHVADSPLGSKPPVIPDPEPEPEPVVPPKPAEKPEYACEAPGCGRSDFKSKASLTRHTNANHPPEDKE